MTSRTTASTVTFAYPFTIAGCSDERPAGNYEITTEENLLQNLSFAAYRRTVTHLRIEGLKGTGHTEMRPIDPSNLELALSLDQMRSTKVKNSEAAPSPLEDRS